MTNKPPESLAVRCVLERIRGTKLLAAAADSRLLTGDLERGCPLLAVAERECNEILAEIAALTEDEADSVEPFFTSLEIYLWHVGAPVLLDAGAFANKFEIILN